MIDGVELEGAEYLDADESRVEFSHGSLKLNVPNFLWINRIQYESAMNNPKLWKTNSETGQQNLGIDLTILKFTSLEIKKPDSPANLDNTYGANDPNYNSANHTALRKTKQSGYKLNDKRLTKERILSGASTGTAAGATGALALNAVNFGFEQYMIFGAVYDNSKIKSHEKIAAKAYNNVMTALNDKDGKYIPVEYQNTESLVNIMNVVLQGVNNTDDKKIYEIGMKIYNEISKPQQNESQEK